MRKLSFLILPVMIGIISFGFSPENDAKNSNLRLTQIAGKKLFTLKKCSDCHTLAEEADGKLTPVPNKREQAWFSAHVEKESPVVLREAKSKRRERKILQAEIAALDDYLYQSKPAEKEQIDNLPQKIFDGAYLSYQNNCMNCHAIAGAGKEIGPDLTFIADKYSEKERFIKNLRDPQQFAPESPMPKFDTLPEEDLSRIADYLLTLRK